MSVSVAAAPSTERDMLDLLNRRYGRTYRNGPVEMVRWIRAEHVRAFSGIMSAPRTCDYIAMDTWPGIPLGSKLALHGHEVKVSRPDWLTELRDPEKAEAFRPYMHYWWLVVSNASIVRENELPESWGLMVTAGGRLRAIKPAPRQEPLPLPLTLTACLLRSAVKTSSRLGADR